MQVRARHYRTGQLVDLEWEDGVVRSIATAPESAVAGEHPWVCPALFDLQINGCHGTNFSSETLTTSGVSKVVATCRQHGIAGFCPTIVTNHFDAMAHGLRTICRARADDRQVRAALPAIHLEGPYISPDDGPRGAHPAEHVRVPVWDEFQRLQDAAEGLIRLVTLAPELPGAIAFIEALRRTGVRVALGHTAASASQIQSAIQAGATLSTHLGNGCHALLPRHDNILWHQLAADDLWASLICDGAHLPKDVLRCILRIKSTPRLILTCDLSPVAGLPPGRYREWDRDIEVMPDGRIMLAGTHFLAGSGSFTDECIAQLLRWGEATLGDAIDMASIRPRQLLGLSEPVLERGQSLDLLLFEAPGGRDFRPVHLLTRH